MENELYHYGVPGMKWGVRRYQNKDGSLTSAGKRRFKSVDRSERKQQEHTERAKWLLKGNSGNAKIYAKEDREAARDMKFAMSKSDYDRIIDHAKQSITRSKVYDQMIKDIDSGTLKAGRDFVTTIGKNGHFTDVENGIVFKKTDKEIQTNRYKAKDDKTYAKTGIEVRRDDMNRVASLKAENMDLKQLKKLRKMQKSIARKGDY